MVRTDAGEFPLMPNIIYDHEIALVADIMDTAFPDISCALGEVR
jgi:hypothetical protein